MKIFTCTLLSMLVCMAANAQQANQLTDQEKKQGWKLLFNGRDLNGWHGYNHRPIGPRWVVEDGTLALHTGLQEGGDIITDEMIRGNFEFLIDWKIAPSTNNGVFLFVDEAASHKTMYEASLELQVQDNRVYQKEKEDNKHLAGDFFGILKATNAQTNKLGEWNQYRVVFKNSILDVYLNGKRIHHVAVKGAAWKNAVAKSFLKDAPFAKGKYEGHIGLQDWHSKVWYRNIKFRHI